MLDAEVEGRQIWSWTWCSKYKEAVVGFLNTRDILTSCNGCKRETDAMAWHNVNQTGCRWGLWYPRNPPFKKTVGEHGVTCSHREGIPMRRLYSTIPVAVTGAAQKC